VVPLEVQKVGRPAVQREVHLELRQADRQEAEREKQQADLKVVPLEVQKAGRPAVQREIHSELQQAVQQAVHSELQQAVQRVALLSSLQKHPPNGCLCSERLGHLLAC